MIKEQLSRTNQSSKKDVTILFLKTINYIPDHLSWLLSVNSVKSLIVKGFFLLTKQYIASSNLNFSKEILDFFNMFKILTSENLGVAKLYKQ